jgi:hypothetical protein
MRWRKTTWAILIWTAVMALLAFLMVTLDASTEDRYRGLLVIVLGVPLAVIWLIGFIWLSVAWFLTPREDVAVYGPQGQQLMVSAREARFWVEKRGWTYEPPPGGRRRRTGSSEGYESAAIEWLSTQRWGPPPGDQPPDGGPPPRR